MNTLHLVRHGHTPWNDTGGVAGRTDIALSDAGRQAVNQVRAALLQEPFDGQLLQEILEDTQRRGNRLRGAALEALVERLAEMSPAERQALADRLGERRR